MNLRVLLFIALSFALSNCFAQQNDSYLMKWKIKPGEHILYKTVLDEVDTLHHRTLDLSAMEKMLPGNYSDSARAIFKQLDKTFAQSTHFLTTLEKGKNDLIEIVMSDPDSIQMKSILKMGPADEHMKAALKKMTAAAVLRGTITEDGEIASFYTKNEQKNLLAQFFELPGRPVKEGDSWPLSINFISMDQSFKCDSSFHENKVIVTHINNRDGEHIVQLKYKVVEYVIGDFNSPFDDKTIRTSMKFTLDAIADFSIEKGRWLNYDGILVLSSTGVMNAQTTKRVALIAN